MPTKALSHALAVGSLVLVMLVPAPASGQVCGPDVDGRVANVTYRDSLIRWDPVVEYETMILTVAGPCEDIVKVFQRGEPIAFDLREIERMTDGAYRWELRRVPFIDSSTQAALAEARVTGDDRIWWELWTGGSIPKGPYVDSQSFLVVRGLIVPPGGEERGADKGPAEKAGTATSVASSGRSGPLTPVIGADQVIPDDLIVQGSACVGLDCVNNESFGFDTIRMKENNLRIKFDDTSTLAGFPSRDWQLTANDSASGGASKFSIEDVTGSRVPFTVTAGAPSNSLFVDSAGQVGLRTSTPVLDLHISTGDTPGIRLEQTSAGGFTAQTWDIGANEASFFVRDVTGGSRLSFRIRPGAPTSSIDISADGDVGIGTASPTQKLDVASGKIAIGDHSLGERTLNGNNPEDLEVNALRNTIYNIDSDSNSTNAGFVVVRNSDATQVIFVAREDNLVGVNIATPTQPFIVGTNATNGNGAHVTPVGVWTNGSSRVNKENIRTLTSQDAFAALSGLEPVLYTGKGDPEAEEYVGFIAEDVPDLVATKSRTGLSSMDIVAVLTKVVKEQEKTIGQMEKTISDLAAQVAELQAAREAPAPQP